LAHLGSAGRNPLASLLSNGIVTADMTKQTKAKSAALSRIKKYEDRYREVLDAAAVVFADKGYHGASIQDISNKLGIRQASLYYYASSKEELLEVVCELGAADFVKFAESVRDSDSGFREKISSIICNHLESIRRIPNYVQVFINCRHHLPPASRRKIGEYAREYESLIEDILSGGVKSSEFRSDLNSRIATLALLGMCNSVPRWLRSEKKIRVKQIAKEFSEVFLVGIKTDITD